MADRLMENVVAGRDGIPYVVLPSRPDGGRFRIWRWKRLRQKIEYQLFVTGGMWGSVEWSRVKAANSLEGVWQRD